MIGLLAAHYLFSGCGTRTKTKTESSKETEVKTEAKEKDSLVKLDQFIATKVEETTKDIAAYKKENATENELETTVTETLEVESKEPVYMELSNGKFLNVNNGRITKTKTTTTSKKNNQKITDSNIKIAEKTQLKIDSINTSMMIKTAMKEAVTEVISNQKNSNVDVEQKGWQPGFWFWFWIIFILLLIITFAYLYKKYGTPLGWWGLIFNKIIK